MNRVTTRYCVYEHILDDTVFYIGYGQLKRAYHLYSRKRRWSEYVKNRRKDVTVKIVREFDNPEEAKQFEIEWSIRRREEGCPIVGLIGNYHDPEQDQLFSKSRSGKLHTTETKEKISRKVRESMNKPEIREHLSQMKKGQKLSEEHKRKISEGMKRYKQKIRKGVRK